MRIGELASRAGVRASTIRHYERRGLLPVPGRVNSQRHYTENAVTRLGVITVAKRAGLSLDEIRVLLDASDHGHVLHEPLQALAERKLPEVEDLIERAERVKLWLRAAQGCGCDTLDVCALFDERVTTELLSDGALLR